MAATTFDPLLDVYTPQECIAAQEKYCKENQLPLFAPSDGYCPHCRSNIYAGLKGYSLRKSMSTLITGCPRCGYSFCD